MFFGKVDRETAILYGWEQLVKNIEVQRSNAMTVKNILFSDYRLGSLYAFHSEDFSIRCINGKRETQFDIWRDEDQQFYPV